MTKQELINSCHSWWYCDNILNHPEQVGLLRMDFPQMFILMRNYDISYWADFDKWKSELIEVTFFNKEDKLTANLDSLLIEAWNFLALTEEEEERQAILAEEEDILEDF